MQHFYYSFVLTLFHSLWQAMLLLMGFYAILFFNKNSAPLFKRNILFSLLGLQLVLSVSSFFIVYFSTSFLQLSSLLPGVDSPNTYAQWQTWLFASYILLVGFKSRNLFYSYNRLRLLKKGSFLKVSPELKIFMQQKAFLLGIKRPVTIAFHKHITTPLTYGFLKPVILLPFSLCNAISMSAAETLILHELTHIKNKDYLLNLFLPWIENIFFFNPFIQIIIKDIRLEREKSCDWQVLQFNYEPIAYAEVLLQTAKHPQAKQNLFLAAVSKTSQLLNRIKYFSEPKNLVANKSTNRWMAMPFFFIIGLFCLIVLANNKQEVKIEVAQVSKTENLVRIAEQNPIIKKIEAFHLTDKNKPLLAKVSFAEVIPETQEGLPVEDFKNIVASNTLVIDSLSLAAHSYNIVPVNYTEADSLLTREVTVTEEYSGGEKVTRTYLVRLVKGEWQAAPLWMVKEIPAKADSLKTVLKDSIAPLHLTLAKDSLKEF